MLDIKKLMVKMLNGLSRTLGWLESGTNQRILALLDAPSSASYGAILRIRGTAVEGTSGTDTYWIGVDSTGLLYSGTQLNGSSTITWYPFYSVNIAQTQTITALNKSWIFRKVGRTVYIDASGDASGSIGAGSTKIGTLADGLKPPYNVYLKCNNTTADVRLNIMTNGDVYFYHPSATTGAINCGFSGYSYLI